MKQTILIIITAILLIGSFLWRVGDVLQKFDERDV